MMQSKLYNFYHPSASRYCVYEMRRFLLFKQVLISRLAAAPPDVSECRKYRDNTDNLHISLLFSLQFFFDCRYYKYFIFIHLECILVKMCWMCAGTAKSSLDSADNKSWPCSQETQNTRFQLAVWNHYVKSSWKLARNPNQFHLRSHQLRHCPNLPASLELAFRCVEWTTKYLRSIVLPYPECAYLVASVRPRLLWLIWHIKARELVRAKKDQLFGATCRTSSLKIIDLGLKSRDNQHHGKFYPDKT